MAATLPPDNGGVSPVGLFVEPFRVVTAQKKFSLVRSCGRSPSAYGGFSLNSQAHVGDA
jgi:hypothetical protein